MPYTRTRTSTATWLDGLTPTERTRIATLHDEAVALYADGARAPGVREALAEHERFKGEVKDAKVMQTLALILAGLDHAGDRRTSRRLTAAE